MRVLAEMFGQFGVAGLQEGVVESEGAVGAIKVGELLITFFHVGSWRQVLAEVDEPVVRNFCLLEKKFSLGDGFAQLVAARACGGAGDLDFQGGLSVAVGREKRRLRGERAVGDALQKSRAPSR